MVVLDFIVRYGITILSVALAIVGLIMSIIKAHRAGNTKGVLSLYAQIPNLVAQAENLFGKGNGFAKLNYVLTELRVIAMENNIAINKADLTEQINNVVNTTKVVNVDTPKVEQTTETTTNVDNANNATNTQNTIIV